MPLKFLMNGILGCILQKIKLKILHNLKKFDWQKPHQSNLTGSDKFL